MSCVIFNLKTNLWFFWCVRVLCVNVSFLVQGDIRNDLYLTLERGDFERGGKSVQKNIEVTMYVLYADGEILKVSRCPAKEMQLILTQITPEQHFFFTFCD